MNELFRFDPAEFDQEMASTRKLSERVPEDKLAWHPRPKSHPIGWDANHLADLPGWAVMTLREDSLDMNPAGGQPYRPPRLTTGREIIAAFDKNVAEARAGLEAVTDERIMQPWSLLGAGETIFTMPKAAVIRSFVLNHIIHHRAIVRLY